MSGRPILLDRMGLCYIRGSKTPSSSPEVPFCFNSFSVYTVLLFDFLDFLYMKRVWAMRACWFECWNHLHLIIWKKFPAMWFVHWIGSWNCTICRKRRTFWIRFLSINVLLLLYWLHNEIQQLKIVYRPAEIFNLRDFHHAVNSLPLDCFLPDLVDSIAMASENQGNHDTMHHSCNAIFCPAMKHIYMTTALRKPIYLILRRF